MKQQENIIEVDLFVCFTAFKFYYFIELVAFVLKSTYTYIDKFYDWFEDLTIKTFSNKSKNQYLCQLVTKKLKLHEKERGYL